MRVMKYKRREASLLAAMTLALLMIAGATLAADPKQPNILVIWGDDIGWNNPSAYHRDMMGYQTPNIDRLAKEGALFTDWYGQQSCTAGRAAFLTGQSPFRTGLLKVGLPGAKEGRLPASPRPPRRASRAGNSPTNTDRPGDLAVNRIHGVHEPQGPQSAGGRRRSPVASANRRAPRARRG